MNTVNGSFRSGLEISPSIYTTTTVKHGNAKCNWTKKKEGKNQLKKQQQTTNQHTSHHDDKCKP